MQNDPNNAFQLSPLEGHQDLISQFVTAFDENRLHHAWLFSGPEGIGKAKLAQ
jgi:DNA polymerase-3 subunit delta'